MAFHLLRRARKSDPLGIDLVRRSAGVTTYDAPRALQVRKRFTTAEVNAGATVVAAPGAGYALRMVDAVLIAVGGNAATATTVDLIGTSAAAARKLLAATVGILTRSTVVRAGQTNASVLADGASFTANDANTPITIGKTNSNLATATHIDVILTYAIDRV